MVLITLILISGCSTVGVTMIGDNPVYPAKPDDCDIKVFMGDKNISRKYVEVCMIDVKTGTTIFDDTSIQGAIKNAKPKACEAGCDAIIIKTASTQVVAINGRASSKTIVVGIKFVGAESGDSATADQYYHAGLVSYQGTKWGEAISYLKATVQINPNYWRAFQLLAYAYYQLNDTQDCIQSCDASLQINPNNPSLQKFDDKLKTQNLTPPPIVSPQQ